MGTATRIASVVAAAGLLVLLSPRSAAAQRTSSLSWVRLEGADQCIGAQELARRVEERVGRRVFVSASQAELSLEGHVERQLRWVYFAAAAWCFVSAGLCFQIARAALGTPTP